MREQLVEFLEEKFRGFNESDVSNLKVDAYPFGNEEMELQNVIIVGDDECFDGDEFYQYVLDGDKLYKAYFSTEDEDGNELDQLDMVDYSHAYCIIDVTDAVID